MSDASHHTTPHAPAAHGSHDHGHNIPLWGLFLALLALTAGEVGLFEYWHHTAASGHAIFPKYVMVILLLVMTLPKAAIVMIYFMHLKFEKPLVVLLAVTPLSMVFVCVLPSLVDTLTIKGHNYSLNHVEGLQDYAGNHGDKGDAHSTHEGDKSGGDQHSPAESKDSE